MARIKATETPEGKPITPNEAPEHIPKEATRAKRRRALQNRRPTLKGLKQQGETEITSNPIYDMKGDVVTKKIPETKGVVPRPQGAQRQEVSAPTHIQPVTVATPRKGPVASEVAEARRQQKGAIEEARAAHAAQERDQAPTTRALDQRKREREEAGHRVSLDSQGRYSRAL